jgi:hypothetical protein
VADLLTNGLHFPNRRLALYFEDQTLAQPIVKEIQRPLGDLCFAFQQLTAKGITHMQTLTVNKNATNDELRTSTHSQ